MCSDMPLGWAARARPESSGTLWRPRPSPCLQHPAAPVPACSTRPCLQHPSLPAAGQLQTLGDMSGRPRAARAARSPEQRRRPLARRGASFRRAKRVTPGPAAPARQSGAALTSGTRKALTRAARAGRRPRDGTHSPGRCLRRVASYKDGRRRRAHRRPVHSLQGTMFYIFGLDLSSRDPPPPMLGIGLESGSRRVSWTAC